MPIPSPTDETNYFIKKGYKPKGEKVCECCGKIIVLYLKRDLIRKKFCSQKCRAKFNCIKYNLKPPRPTEETYKKIAKTLSLKMEAGLIPKPPKPTPESRKKAALKIRGEKHFKWIKDRSKLKRSRFNNSFRNEGPIASWRSSIFKRDQFTCQKCNQVGGKLNAHHIKPWADFPELRFDMSNGVTLCVNCHREIHKKCH
jgi:hypothetical protein